MNGSALFQAASTVGSLAGGGTVTMSGTLTAGGDNTSTTYSGVLSGTGGLTKTGSGTLTLTGANSYTSGTTVSAGTLAGTTTSLQGNITNNATVTFNQAGNGTYAGVISGTGGVTITGGGTVTLSGNNTYSGATTITQGGLNVSGTHSGAITVASGTTLTISGTVSGPVTVQSGGSVVVQPGGTLTQDATTTTLLSSANPSTSGQSVTLTATVAGATPTGSVDFRDGSVTIGSCGAQALGSGAAICSTSALSTGSHTITAVYSGDTNNATSTSAPLTQTVNAQPIVTLGLTGSPAAENGGVATVTATLSAASGLDTTVNLGLTGTATGGGTDYTASGTSITILAGATTGTVTLTAVQDTLDEADETIIVDITSVANGTESGTQQVIATITDDDAPPSVSFTAASQSVSEGASTATVTAQLSAASSFAVTVPFTLTGTAAGTDYSATSSPLTIAAGSTTATITVTITSDTLDEADETVIVTMGSPTNASQGATTVHTLTISDDDAAPTVSFTAAGQAVGEATGAATITAQLSAASSFAVTVPFTLSGTASGADYSATVSPITVAAGNMSATVTITISNDTLDEADETVIVTMGAPTNATQGATTVHTLTLTDDDSAPSVTLSVDNTSIAEGGVATVTATLSNPSSLTVTVILTASGSALPGGVDYNADNPNGGTGGTGASGMTIDAGATTGSMIIRARQDAECDPGETIILDISAVQNGIAGAVQRVTITIGADEAAPQGSGGGGGSPAPPSSPPTSAVQNINPAAGGTVSLGGISIVLPPGAVPGTEGATVTLENATVAGRGSASVAALTLTLSQGEREAPPAQIATSPAAPRNDKLAAAGMTLPVPEGSAFGSAAFMFTVHGVGGKGLALAAPVTVSAKYSAADKAAGPLKLMAYNGDMRWVDLKADDDGMETLKANTTMTGLFAIVIELPRPALSGPAAGTVTMDLGPMLSWTNPAGTTQTQVQVIPFNNDGPGINLIRNGDPSTTSGQGYQVQAPAFGAGGYVMLPGISYTWRVRTSSSPNRLGETDAGWSHWASGSFRTPAPSSGTITPVRPSRASGNEPGSGNEPVESLLPTLAWTDSNTQVFYYEVQLSKDPGFGTNAFLFWELRHGGVTSPPNSYTVPRQYPLESGTEYYWRVRPRVQGDGAPVEWSPSWSFKTP